MNNLQGRILWKLFEISETINKQDLCFSRDVLVLKFAVLSWGRYWA